MSYTAYDMTTRVNARLDDDLSRALDRYRQRTGLTVTEVLERALERFLELDEPERSPLQVFKATGFIGVEKGPADLAREAKQHLTASLEKKR